MGKRFGIKDIAQIAGVSKGTVDRVLHKRGNVSPDAKKKVLAAMVSLDYEPNLIASALASKKGWKLAVLLPNAEGDPFWEQPRQGIERATQSLRDYGVTVDLFLFEDGQPAHFQQLGKEILNGCYDGLLVSPTFSKESNAFLNECEEMQLCYVQINTYLERKHDCFLAYIGQDSYSSGVLAAKLLHFEMKANEKAVILHLEKEVNNAQHLMDKQAGFNDYFKNHSQKNIQILQEKFGDVHDVKELESFIERILKEEPDISGIFVSTSKLYHVVPLIKKFGQKPIGLIGFDLIQENLQYLETEEIHFLINQNPFKQGFLGVMNLFNHLALKKEVEKIQYLPLDVVMRENAQYYLEDKYEKLHLII